MSYMCECNNNDCRLFIPEEAVGRRETLNLNSGDDICCGPYKAHNPDCKGDDRIFAEKGDGFVIVKTEREE